MSDLYNRPFKLGFVVTIVFFALLNLAAYLFAARVYDQIRNQPITWAPGPRFPDWGIPFSWKRNNYGGDWVITDLFGLADGLMLNLLSIVVISFLVGLIVRFFAVRFK
jgi:hypothetical protein